MGKKSKATAAAAEPKLSPTELAAAQAAEAPAETSKPVFAKAMSLFGFGGFASSKPSVSAEPLILEEEAPKPKKESKKKAEAKPAPANAPAPEPTVAAAPTPPPSAQNGKPKPAPAEQAPPPKPASKAAPKAESKAEPTQAVAKVAPKPVASPPPPLPPLPQPPTIVEPVYPTEAEVAGMSNTKKKAARRAAEAAAAEENAANAMAYAAAMQAYAEAQAAHAAAKGLDEATETSSSKKKKKKVATEESPPLAAPTLAAVEDEQAKTKKKKKNNASKKEEPSLADPPKAVGIKKPPGPTGAQVADELTEKDENLKALRDRLTDLESMVADGQSRPADWNKELECLLESISALLEDKKVVYVGGKRQPSEMLAQSLKELQDAGEKEMARDVEKQLEQAKEVEVYVSLKTKVNGLKARAEEVVKKASDAAKPKAAAKASADAPLSPTAVAEAAAREEQEREQYFLVRLQQLHEKELKPSMLRSQVVKEEKMGTDVMKYVFDGRSGLDGRIEKDFGVALRAVGLNKASKGKGKGAPALPKECFVAGLSNDDVAKCAAALAKFDFSGSKKQEIGSAFQSYHGSAIEKELGCYLAKRGRELFVYGSYKQVEAAIAKAEAVKPDEPPKTSSVDVDPDVMKVIRPLLSEWSETTKTKMWVPGQSDGTKVLISSKDETAIDKAVKKVETFVKQTVNVFVEGDTVKIKEGAQGGFVGQKYKNLREENPSVYFLRKPEGVRLIGKKDDVERVQEAVESIFAMADTEPMKFDLQPEQRAAFNRDTISMLEGVSGAQITIPRGEGFSLVIYGDEEAMAKAQAEVLQVIANEGSFETLDLTSAVVSALLEKKAAKIQELEDKYGDVKISVDRRTNTVKMVGAATSVKSCKSNLSQFAKKKEKEIADTIVREMIIDASQIPRIIGRGGETIKGIRSACKVEINIPKDESDEPDRTIELRGVEEEVCKAEDMINEIIDKAAAATAAWEERQKGRETRQQHAREAREAREKEVWENSEQKAPAKSRQSEGQKSEPNGKATSKAASPPKKKVEEFTASLEGDDFPSFGAVTTKARPTGHWGARQAASEQKAAAEEPQEAAFGELPSKAKVEAEETVDDDKADQVEED